MGEVVTLTFHDITKFAPVSVIIPCYRCGDTISRAVESVINQTRPPNEIILIDDFSNDEQKTLNILNRLCQINQGITLKILKLDKNSGAGSARNAGWAIATQPYIAFLDSDDSWHPNKLEIQYKYMANNPDVTLSGHQYIFWHGERMPKVVPEIAPATEISTNSMLFKNAFSTSTVMVKSNIKLHFNNEKRYSEDFFLWQKMIFLGFKLIQIESPLGFYYKPLYGSSGLSARLWAMEKGELGNFLLLYKAGHINLVFLVLSSIFSLIKFLRRLVITGLHRLSANKSL